MLYGKNKKKEVTIKGIIIAVLLVVLVLWYFNHLSNRSSIQRSNVAKDRSGSIDGV